MDNQEEEDFKGGRIERKHNRCGGEEENEKEEEEGKQKRSAKAQKGAMLTNAHHTDGFPSIFHMKKKEEGDKEEKDFYGVRA